MSLDQLKARAEMKPQGRMNAVTIRGMAITMGEIRELCAQNPEHPNVTKLKEFYDKMSSKFPDNYIVYYDRTLVLAILEGDEVETVTEEEDGRETKTLKTKKKSAKKKEKGNEE